MSDLSNPIFHDETKAREWLEARVWLNGPVCRHCGVVDQATLMKGKSHRHGLYQCNACREPFTLKTAVGWLGFDANRALSLA
jgi:Transposase zinc-ribbon domain